MTRVEELPDDFDETLNPNEAPELTTEDDAVFEEMFYNRFAKKGADKPETNPKSFDEVMQDLSKTPLFMNNLDDAADAGMQKLSDHRAVLADAEEYVQMVRIKTWMPFEHYSMKAPRSRLVRALRSREMKW